MESEDQGRNQKRMQSEAFLSNDDNQAKGVKLKKNPTFGGAQ